MKLRISQQALAELTEWCTTRERYRFISLLKDYFNGDELQLIIRAATKSKLVKRTPEASRK